MSFRTHFFNDNGLWRWWLYRDDRTLVSLEVTPPGPKFWRECLAEMHAHVGVQFFTYSDNTCMLHTRIPFVGGAYFSFNSRMLDRLVDRFRKAFLHPDDVQIRTEINMYSDWLRLSIVRPDDDFNVKDTKQCWRGVSVGIHVLDVLFGRMKVTTSEVSRHAVLIPMPEKAYPATVTIKEMVYKRPRWFADKRVYCDIEIPTGIPFMGKGENSWDCGEDGLYGCGSEGSSLEDAITKTVSIVLRNRRKYGHCHESHRAVLPEVESHA